MKVVSAPVAFSILGLSCFYENSFFSNSAPSAVVAARLERQGEKPSPEEYNSPAKESKHGRAHHSSATAASIIFRRAYERLSSGPAQLRPCFRISSNVWQEPRYYLLAFTNTLWYKHCVVKCDALFSVQHPTRNPGESDEKNVFAIHAACAHHSGSSGDSQTYGKAIQTREVTAVSAILDTPDVFIGKTVRVEGMILEVCAKRGCWV